MHYDEELIEDYILDSYDLTADQDDIDVVTYFMRYNWLHHDPDSMAYLADHHSTYRDVDPDKEPIVWRIDICHMTG